MTYTLINRGQVFNVQSLEREELDRLVCDPHTIIVVDGVPMICEYKRKSRPIHKNTDNDLAMIVALASVL